MKENPKGIVSVTSRVSDVRRLIETFKVRGAQSDWAKRILYDVELALLRHEQMREYERARERAAQSKVMRKVGSLRMRAAQDWEK